MIQQFFKIIFMTRFSSAVILKGVLMPSRQINPVNSAIYFTISFYRCKSVFALCLVISERLNLLSPAPEFRKIIPNLVCSNVPSCKNRIC